MPKSVNYFLTGPVSLEQKRASTLDHNLKQRSKLDHHIFPIYGAKLQGVPAHEYIDAYVASQFRIALEQSQL